MSKTLRRLWNDDEGAIISVELILIIGILIFGIIPGLVALRNSIVAAMVTTGNILSASVANQIGVNGIGVSGFPANAGDLIAYVGGFQFQVAPDDQLATIGLPPTGLAVPTVINGDPSPITAITPIP